MATTYTPMYSTTEVQQLLKLFISGSLDGIHSKHKVILGVRDCDRPSHGFRSLPLAERYTSEDLRRVFSEMGTAKEPAPTHAMMILLESQFTLDTVARALHQEDCSHAQSLLTRAYDDFVTRLFVR